MPASHVANRSDQGGSPTLLLVWIYLVPGYSGPVAQLLQQFEALSHAHDVQSYSAQWPHSAPSLGG
jgi:hypothetical protein